MTETLAQPFDIHFSDLTVLSTDKFYTYRAYDTKANLPVVLKVFPNTPANSPKYYNEKSHLLSLNHPHVVRLIQAVDTAPTPAADQGESISYLVLEYAAHGDFFDVVNNNKGMPEMLARTFFHQLIEAVSYLHSQNIAHLDIKMQNILLNQDYKLKLADFDLSQRLDSSKLEGKGTIGYRAPEVKQGVCSDFRAADLYSVGIILFALVTGTEPYGEDEYSLDGSGYDKWYKQFHDKNELFWKRHSRSFFSTNYFSDSFKELLNKLLSKDPKERPTIEDIKGMEWYNKEILTGDAYAAKMKEYLKN